LARTCEGTVELDVRQRPQACRLDSHLHARSHNRARRDVGSCPTTPRATAAAGGRKRALTMRPANRAVRSKALPRATLDRLPAIARGYPEPGELSPRVVKNLGGPTVATSRGEIHRQQPALTTVLERSRAAARKSQAGRGRAARRGGEAGSASTARATPAAARPQSRIRAKGSAPQTAVAHVRLGPRAEFVSSLVRLLVSTSSHATMERSILS
jgi:hypothetical protein